MLLSFAGFPAAAGVDLQARIEPSQFNAFRSFFAGALRVLACAQRIWDHASHDVICGFGVSHHHVSETLSTQPVGTFLCYLSMPPTCELVIACKVRLRRCPPPPLPPSTPNPLAMRHIPEPIALHHGG